MPYKRNIAIDYDDTFSADIEGFRIIAQTLLDRGHDVRIVTARGQGGKEYRVGGETFTLRDNNNADLERAIEGLNLPVIYVGWDPKGKMYHCVNNVGWHVDIWFDDKPSAITKGYY